MNPILQAMILGIIEGLTEFLPISSTGHLKIAENLMGFQDTAFTFTVVIQIGAILAVVWYYRVDLWQRVLTLFQGKPLALKFWGNLIIGTVPAAVLGLLIDKFLNGALETLTVIGTALIVGGVLLYWLETMRVKQNLITESLGTNLDAVTPLQAFYVGCFQALAVIFPGTSRSGASIVGGWLLGMNRVTATTFSFYLGLPALGLAGLYKLYKAKDILGSLPGGVPALIVGTVVSFVCALLVIGGLLRYVSKNDFKPFAIYRIIAGVILLTLVFTGVVQNA